MKIENRKSNTENRRAGFTLLELLVAISILVIIVMMMAGVFFQSRVAWGTGLRRSRMAMEGRAVIDFIANELAQAVADETLECMIQDGQGITFYMLDQASPERRAVKQVTYSYAGDRIRRSVRDVTFSPYVAPGPIREGYLARNVSSFQFITPDGGPYRTNLPAWVDIELTMRYRGRASHVRVGSGGRSGWGNEDDNIWSDN